MKSWGKYGAFIRAYRKSNKMTQMALGVMMGLNANTGAQTRVQSWEHGVFPREPYRSQLDGLAVMSECVLWD